MMMSEYNPMHEEEANWFAGAILVPRDALLNSAARGLKERAAADYFGVSLRGLSNEAKSHWRRRSTFTPTRYLGSLGCSNS